MTGLLGRVYLGERCSSPAWLMDRGAVSGATNSRKPPGSRLGTSISALRPAHWVKNLLLLVPALLAHADLSLQNALSLLVGVLSMNLAASAGYLANDVNDLEADRQHASKRHRPVASGLVGPRQAGLAGVALAAVSLAIATLVLGPEPGVLVAAYLLATVCYSRVLKCVLWLDVAVLAGLYVWRLVIGGAIAAIELSPWLIGFASPLFLALALMKRLDELSVAKRTGVQLLAGRPYRHQNRTAVLVASAAFSLAALSILALYISLSESAAQHYHHRLWLWVSGSLFALWLANVLRSSLAGRVFGDPVLFAASDTKSLLLTAGSGLALLAAI